ncbi:hypothetical protein ABB37_09426 [Leptomonas pyrrhocoris]|uniref:Protein kinase domain-containing protein n=1 Tax=Leptomonas pyrrhocoris TaxID=157538 RepID=A0A0M9FQR3_LEPPY|nr:hypothetical protein ABB37_09426 [Leptomonas pyrrhocoris]KPA74160.1 hypothetical protein ABB37_09426 [Leptomonas pyrrhocoris]|eukprot:XP_015652599.1 hypothetical protein ABB37_09426 [Leptomonas pyrrhocoris]
MLHDLPHDRGPSLPFAFGGGGGGGGRRAVTGIGGTYSSNGVGVSNGVARTAADGPARGDTLCGDPSPSSANAVDELGGSTVVGEAGVNGRRLPRPTPVPRWSQVPPEARPSTAPYLLHRYGRGGGGGGGLGESLNAFKLYVADDGEMKMGDHHNDFYGFNYDPTDETDEMANLRRQLLGASGGGGDFYEDTEDSVYGSSDDAFEQRNSYAAGGEAAYEKGDAENTVADLRSWAVEPALQLKGVSRRRRLPPKRPGGAGHRGKKKGRRLRRHLRDALTGAPFSRQASKENGGGGGAGTTQMLARSNRSLSYTTSTMQRNGRTSSGTAPPALPAACVRPGAYVAAAAAAYPDLPASLGALVLLSPGNPSTNPLDKVNRVRRRLLQRQRDERRECEWKQRARRSLEAQKQQAAGAAAAGADAPKGITMTSQSPRTPHHTANGASDRNDGANTRLPHPLTELRFSFEDLNRSTGPGTARMGAGASLDILRSARQRVRESPRLQDVPLKNQAVYVRAAPNDLASAAGQNADARAQSGGKTLGVMNSGAAASASRQPRELCDPYTGVVIPASFDFAAGQSRPAVVFSCATGIPFFHDPTAPRPIAVVDVAQPLPLSPPPLLSPTATYILPSSLQQPLANVARQPSQARRSSVQTNSSLGSSHTVSMVPTIRFPPSPPPLFSLLSTTSVDTATVAATKSAAGRGSNPTPDRSVNPSGYGASTPDDVTGRHARTETASYHDARLAYPNAGNDSERCGKHDATLNRAFPHSPADPRQELVTPLGSSSGTSAVNALTAGEYRMPSAITGGNGPRQRWRPHGSVVSGGGGVSGFDGATTALNGNGAGLPPPWRWLHGPLSPSAVFSARSSASGGSRGGQRELSISDAVDGSAINSKPDHPGGGGAAAYPSLSEGNAVSGSTAAMAAPVFNLRGLSNACEANWAALRNATPWPRPREPGTSPLLTLTGTNNAGATTAAQIPRYPSLVAPYAAPRNPLQQNIRYNAWTADGVAASSGAACVVHVFTITREMLRSVHEYVAHRCAQRHEMAVRERERARQRRMKDAMAAGVLTRDLQRCLRCPHCGVVGQILKSVPSRSAGGPSLPQRSQPHAQTPHQLSQSVNQVRGMSSSPHSFRALRVSASASSFDMETQKQLTQQPQTERGRHALAYSERASPQHVNMAPPPHAPSTASTGSSTAHPSVAHPLNTNCDVNAPDKITMELPGHDAFREGAAGTVEEEEVHVARSVTHAIGNKEVTHEAESATTITPISTSPPTLGGPSGHNSSLPPLPPTYATQHARLVSRTQSMTSPNDNTGFPSTAFSSQKSPPQSAAALASRAAPLPEVTTAVPSVAIGTPNKRRPSPTFTANTATGPTADNAEANVEVPLEKSGGSRELSRSFAGLQPQRTSSSQPDFQRYSASSFHNGVFSSDSHYSLSHVIWPRASQEREESSLRDSIRTSDGSPGVPVRGNVRIVSINGEEEEEEFRQHVPPLHSSFGLVRRYAPTPPPPSYSSLPEGFLTPLTVSIGRQDSTSPTLAEFTVGGHAATNPAAAVVASAYTKRLLSPSSPSLLPAGANVLPPLATYGSNSSFSMPPTANTSRQATRPPPPPPPPPPAGFRTSGNGSFAASTQVSAFTPAVPPLAPLGTPLIGDTGAHSNANSGSNAMQSRDFFGESVSATMNRESCVLPRRYVCQSCHRDVVPKTSMVSLALLEDRALSKSVNEAALSALMSDKTDHTHFDESFGVLAFDDLLQDDALIYALQAYLQESLMLPATRPPRPPRTAATPLMPDAASAAPTSVVSPNPHFVPSGSLLSDLAGPKKTEMRSPTLPPSASASSAFGGVGAEGKAKATDMNSIDASRVQLLGALCPTGEGAPQIIIEGTSHNADLPTKDIKLQGSLAARANTSAAAATTTALSLQGPLPSFARLSLQSLSSSPSSSSVPCSARPKTTAPEEDDNNEDHAAVAAEDRLVRKSTKAMMATAAAAPVLLRLCVPCCGLKVSVWDSARPRTPAAPPQLDGSVSAGQVPDTTITPAENATPKTPLQRRKSVGKEGGRRQSRKTACPPPTIPRMREDAATRGLTQSALLIKKEVPATKHVGKEAAAASAEAQRGRGSRATAAGASRRPSTRRDGRQTETPVAARGEEGGGVAAASFGAAQELIKSSKTVMQDTDASKRHRVQINSRMRLDATSINRIWERVFTQDKSSAVAAVAAGRDKARAKRLKTLGEEAAHTPPAKAKALEAGAAKSTSESPRAAPAAPSSAASLAPAVNAPARIHQHIGIDLSTYDDSSLVLKVELAYPRLPGGNVRQLLHEWGTTYQPHPVLLEAVIRNIVYGVLTQLHTLHAAGYTSGNVKATNVFPMWHLMKATRESGMKMPPCAAATAGDAAAEAHARDMGEGKGDQDNRPGHVQDGANAARGNDSLLRATEQVGRSPPTDTAALLRLRRPSQLWSTSVLQHQAAKESPPSLGNTAAQSAGRARKRGTHKKDSLTSPMPHGIAQPEPRQPQETQGGVAHRSTGTKAPETTTSVEGTHKQTNSLSESNASSYEEGASRSAEEERQHRSIATASTVYSPAVAPQQLASPATEQKGGDTPPTAEALSMPDAMTAHFVSSDIRSGSGIFPFSPAQGMTSSSSVSSRRGRGFSIDDSVIPIVPRRKSTGAEAGGGRRTQSAGPADPSRRGSESTHSRSWEEQEELVPLLVEVVTPSSISIAGTADHGGGGGGSLSVSSPLPKMAAASPRPPVPTAESASSAMPRHGLPKRRGDVSSPTSDSKFTFNYSPAWMEETHRQRYVRGARLIPPARVLLPSLSAGAQEAGGQKRKYEDRQSSSAKAPLLLPSKDAFGESTNEEDNWPTGGAHPLLASGPTGAVPRPKSRHYSHTGSLSSKSKAAGRSSENETDGDGGDGDGSTLDPLQWSQQVMLIDNLGTRVETALCLAMTKVLILHPPCPAHRPTPPAASKEDKGDAQEGKKAASRTNGNPPPGGAGSGKSLNLYVPDLKVAPPAQPVLFGIQEAEYVPPPETMRCARDEAKALWRLWRQQQQVPQRQAPSPLFSTPHGDRSAGITVDDSEAAQMEYVVAQLAEQACPATMLRNTLDPYPFQMPAVDIWQLGMMALDLADGPVPTTWLKQREPTPRLSPYPWSSYFQSFVSRCLQLQPEKRATTEELLHHPWFRVALVPQVTGGGGAPDRRGNRLPSAAFSRTPPSLLPHPVSLPRVPCVMGVDCLTAEEQKEWEGFDYTLLYANSEEVPPLTAAAGSPVSNLVNGVSRLRRASADSPAVSATDAAAAAAAAAVAGHDRIGGAHAGGSSNVGGLAAVSTGGDSTEASQSFGLGTGNNTGGASHVRVRTTTTAAAIHTNNKMHKGGSINTAVAGASDAEFTALSSVDLTQYFTRFAALQWRRQQQQSIAASLAVSFPGIGANRGGGGAAPLAETAGPTALDTRGFGSSVFITSFFEHSLPISAEDVLTMLRQSSSNSRYLQLGSPRQSLYNMLSPRPPQPATALMASQTQQTDSAVPPLPLLGSSSSFGAALKGLPYGLPSALRATGMNAPSPAALPAASGGGGSVAMVGLPSAYVPLRDPRFGSPMNSLNTATTPTFAAGGGNDFVSSRWVSVTGDPSFGSTALAGQQSSQRADSSSPLFQASARDTPTLFSTAVTAPLTPAGVDARRSYSDRFDPRSANLSDADRRTDGEDVEVGSDSSYIDSDSSDSEEDDSDDISYGEQSTRSSSSGLAYGKADYTRQGSSGVRSNHSHIRSLVNIVDESRSANRGGGEVPYRRNDVVSHGDAQGRASRTPGVQLAQNPEWVTGGVGGAAMDRAPSNIAGLTQLFSSASVAVSDRTSKRPQRLGSATPGLQGVAADERHCRSPGAVPRRRPRHLLFGVIATSLARLSTVMGSASDTDSDDSSDSSDADSAAYGEGRLNECSNSFPDSARSGRRRTENFRDAAWEDLALRTSCTISAAAEHRSHTIANSRFTPLSTLNPYARVYGEEEPSSADENDDDSRYDVEVQSDEILRCFSALQRGCPMAVSLWCVRVLQQATLHPRTSAAAGRLLERVERDVVGGAGAKNLAWLSTKNSLAIAGTTAGRRNGDERVPATSVPSTVAVAAEAATSVTAPSPSQTPPPVQDTCPSTFHNYELAKWLYASHQTIPRCV